jgi:WD40 repeat protein
MRPFLVILCLSAAVLADDRKDTRAPIAVVPIPRTAAVSFEKEIQPILAKKCSTCHSGSVQKNRFDVSNLENLMRGGKSGPAVVAGQSAKSRLVQHAGRTLAPFMPPVDEEDLTPQELALIKLWIDQGAPGITGTRPISEVVLSPRPARIKAVRALAFSLKSPLLAIARGSVVHLVEPRSGNEVRRFEQNKSTIDALAFSPDGLTLAAAGFREVALYDVATGELRRRETNFADRVLAVTFSPDGRWLATAGGPATRSGELKLFEAESGKLAFELANAHGDTIFGVSSSADGALLATAGADKFVKVWAIPSGELKKTFEGHAHHVLDVAWKPDSKQLVSAGGDDVIKIWDYERGEAVRTIRGPSKQITCLAFVGRTANAITAGGDATIRLWNMDGGNQIRAVRAGDDFLYSVAVTADGSIIAAAGEDGVVRLLGPDGRPIRSLNPGPR